TNVVQFALITGIVYFYFVTAKEVFCFPQDFYTINHDIKILCFFRVWSGQAASLDIIISPNSSRCFAQSFPSGSGICNWYTENGKPNGCRRWPVTPPISSVMPPVEAARQPKKQTDMSGGGFIALK
ncbi:MAG: hypothetical protein GX103_00495, partial [Bacteroidales bacterium]|nr:hypothetical protein [Bacteroidales bacterium]